MMSLTWDCLQSAQLPAHCLPSTLPPHAGIITLRAADPQATVRRLEADGVYARVIPYPSLVRICVHYLTSETDVQRLIDALPRALSSRS
jgi:L-cysteine/cystine lyase